MEITSKLLNTSVIRIWTLFEQYSNWLVYTFSSQSDEILILVPNRLCLDFVCKIFKYYYHIRTQHTAQKIKFFIKDFSSKCDQIRRKLRIWSNLLKKSLMENVIFCAVAPSNVFKYL